ncbi:RNA polymerase II-specific transcription factor-like protein [Microdochium nivale]|nr:RNA polymerase II-specific transcription factor-like protein [Microdochium nivale]
MLSRPRTQPSPRACLPCRDKHLKCDGQVPVCNRCAQATLPCTYIQSRRGRRTGPVKSIASAPEPEPATAISSRPGMPLPLPLSLPATTRADEFAAAIGQQQPQQQQQLPLPRVRTGAPGAGAGAGAVDEEHLLSLYYQLVHPAHPFLPPQALYDRRPDLLPDHLRRAACFIASHHSPACSDLQREQLRDAATAALEPQHAHGPDALLVQSLLLVALASYARFERDRGARALDAAVRAAYHIGLDSDAYGRGDEAVLRESWRRTWWELYTVAALVSLVTSTHARLALPATRAELPGDCAAYDACQAPARLATTAAMRARFRAAQDLDSGAGPWSSFAYKVEATRILAMVLDAGRDCDRAGRTAPPAAGAAEAAVASFLLDLPADDRREGLRRDGSGAVDDVMSCALMIIHLASICHHLPRSPLVAAADFRTVCGNHLVARTAAAAAAGLDPDAPRRLHQTAAVRSAHAIARLLSAREARSLASLSPCFACALAFSSAVLLAAHAAARPSTLSGLPTTAAASSEIEENINLELGALRALGHMWPVAHVIRRQISQFAREVMGDYGGGGSGDGHGGSAVTVAAVADAEEENSSTDGTTQFQLAEDDEDGGWRPGSSPAGDLWFQDLVGDPSLMLLSEVPLSFGQV